MASTATAAFALTLEDAFSPKARQADYAAKALSSTLSKAKTELAGYQAQLSLAKDLGDVSGHQKYSALVQQSKEKVFNLSQSLEGASSGLGSGASAAGGYAIALGAVVAAAVAAKAAISALVDVTESLVVKSLEVVNTNQLLVAQFEALGEQGPGSGDKTLAMLDELSLKLPQSREQLAQWTRQIEKMGITDLTQIRSELLATASAQAVLGEGGAEAYEKITRKVTNAIEAHGKLKITSKELTRTIGAGLSGEVAAKMGMSLEKLEIGLKAGTVDAQKFGDALRDTMIEKGKGPLDVMSNSLGALKTKAGETIAHFFDGIDTAPLTEALRGLIALGDQGEPSGQSMKLGITGAMNAIIRLIGHGITEAEVFFLELEVGALSAYVALKPIISAIGKIVDGMSAIGGAVGTLTGKGATAVGGAMGVDPATAKASGDQIGQQALFGFAGPIAQMSNLVGQMAGDFANAKALALAQQSGVQIGQATVAGMREGVGAHSPSVEAMRIGMNVGEGLGMGMEQSTAPAHAARTISSNALGGLQGGAALGGAGAQGGDTNTIGPIHISITAPEGVTDAQAISVSALSTVLERYQISSGR